jgi:hypothetical protein
MRARARRIAAGLGAAAALLWSAAAPCAFEREWPDARTAALAGCRLPERPPATWLAEFSAGELYGLPEARGYRVRLSRRGQTSLSLVASGFGRDVYGETAAGLTASRGVGGDAWVSLGARALAIAAPGVPARRCVAVDAGCGAVLLGRVALAGRWWNVGLASIGGSPVAAPASVTASLDLRGASIGGTVTLEGGLDPSTSVAFEIEAGPALALRAGTGTNPRRFAAGIGVLAGTSSDGTRRAAVDLACEWHPELGVSTFVSVSVSR